MKTNMLRNSVVLVTLLALGCDSSSGSSKSGGDRGDSGLTLDGQAANQPDAGSPPRDAPFAAADAPGSSVDAPSLAADAAQDSAPVYTPPPPAKDGAFIQITSGPEHPTSVLMGLTMALQLADDYDVIVFLDVRGPEVALIKTPSLEQKRFEASKILFQRLIDKGIRIVVCRTCLEVLNKTEFDLVKGVKIANKSDLFDFTKGRILSLTY